MGKTENIELFTGCDEIRYIQNRRAKNLSIRINQKGEVRVTMPWYVSRRKAEVFVRSRKQWIERKLVELRKQKQPFISIREGELLQVRGKSIPVLRKKGEASLENAIWRILLVEAKAYLPPRVERIALQHGFRISGTKVRKMESRWGSCSAKHSINLNSWLIMLPEHLSDYVILHELLHTCHRDHGPRFRESLDRLTGGRSKVLNKELRNHRIMSIDTEQQLGCKGDRIKGPVGPDIKIK